MRKIILPASLLFIYLGGYSQTAAELIGKVQQAQSQLESATYTLIRKDTLVTGTVREITGSVKLSVLPADTVFGFKFWAQKDGVNHETIYDGNSCFDVDHDKKQYASSSNPDWLPHFLDNYGGQVVLKDLVKLDTKNVLRFEVKQDAEHYYLLMYLPDLTQYNVIKRSKTITIDKKLMLPVGMVVRQETLGKVQDLNYRIREISINNPSLAYNFNSLRYPPDYTKEKGEINKKLYALMNKQVPMFTLNSFKGDKISSDQFTNKLVLLDFWEVWCGPCVESMPKVQQLFDKYKSKGLLVYGITHQSKELAVAEHLIKENKISFPMLIGNDKSMQQFSINAVPVYILIGKDGKLVLISEGYPANLEEEIQKNL